MITRLAPWQRINIALARGILLKPSGKMKWTANVSVLGTEALTDTQMSWAGVEADTMEDAARSAAMQVAQLLYGLDRGTVGYVNQIEQLPGNNALFMAAIGSYNNGVTKGRSVRVLIREYKGL